jgi:creatinine amidohydrolase
VYMMDLNMTTFQEVQSRMSTVLLPIGMIEAHGPHCSLGTDILIPREFVKRLDPLIGDKVLMAPEIPYGHSFGLAPFPGTIDVSGEAFAQYVLEIGKGFLHNRFRNIILFNGHGGNTASLNLVSEQLADAGAMVLTINWWLDYKEAIQRFAPGTGHAGEDETSVIMASDPSFVGLEYVGQHTIPVPRNLKFQNMGKVAYPQAYSGDAASATAQKGEQIYQALLPLIVKDIEVMWTFSEK